MCTEAAALWRREWVFLAFLTNFVVFPILLLFLFTLVPREGCVKAFNPVILETVFVQTTAECVDGPRGKRRRKGGEHERRKRERK